MVRKDILRIISDLTLVNKKLSLKNLSLPFSYIIEKVESTIS